MVADQNQRGHVNRRQPVHPLHRFQIPINHELPVRSPHLTVKLPVRGRVALSRIVIRIRPRAVKKLEIPVAPRQRLVLGRVAPVLPRRALVKQAGLLQLIQPRQFVRRHLRLLARQHFVHLARGSKGAVEDQVVQVLLVLERVSLRQHAAAAVSQQVDLAQTQRHAHRLHVVRHVFDGVLARILQAFRLARPALVDKDEPVRARQREQPGQKVSVVGAGAAVQHHERRTFAELDVVNQHAVRVHIAALLRVYVGRGLRVRQRPKRNADPGHCQSKNKSLEFHGNHRNALPLSRSDIIGGQLGCWHEGS